jgi:hypothetical protein
MDFLSDWQQPLLWASGLSLMALLATLIAVPWVVTRLPQDYFCREERVVWRDSAGESMFVRVVGMLKNVLGLLLVVLGLIMLLTPGQGILTLLIGLLLMNFPGKYRLERWLVMRPGVLRGLNWLREKRGHAPFDVPLPHSPVDR